MRINHVIALDSPRKLFQFRCAFRKQSCVSVSARSISRVDASRNRKICGRCRSTTRENSSVALVNPVAASRSRAAISSAAPRVIGSNAVPAAIM